MGEARRVALASILVLDPDVFLLDEPTAGLDGFGMELVSSLLEQLRTKHKTLVFASHDRDLVERIATRTITLADGTVRADLRVTPPGIKKGTAQE
jgi:energy-coupling factor transporter ATP-binding protein EcfA2